MHLQAEAMGLGSVPVGAFDDAAVAEVLRLPKDRRIVYILSVGHPQRD
ncbi:MAG: nitroreductase family protein [Proteobacteria bacterium]|nr:nitroreductase family protein [Pseudomonadota bacterium]